MVWADGLLYQVRRRISETMGSGIVVVPADDDATTTVLSGMMGSNSIRAEGENLLYNHDDQLRMMPRAGGQATTLLAGGIVNARENPPESMVIYSSQAALDDAHFYFTTRMWVAPNVETAWRIPRAGGPVEPLGSVPISVSSGAAIVSDGLLVGGHATEGTETTWAAQVATGGASRSLAPITYRLAGVDAGGAVWTAAPDIRSQTDQRFEVMLSPVDGSPARLLSPDLPVEFAADWSIPDGSGGRFISGLERFDDLSTHVVGVRGGRRRGSGTASLRSVRRSSPLSAAAPSRPTRSIWLSTYALRDGMEIVKIPRVPPAIE